jgi:hypothetical protein
MSGGLGATTASLALILGAIAATAAYLRTWDRPKGDDVSDPAGVASPPAENSDPAEPLRRELLTPARKRRYSSIPFWIVAGIFAIFAVRSFCWLLYIDGDELKIQSPYNLGDLALHITYIKDFANGTPLWPANPIFPLGKIRYPAGIDLFNALLCLVQVDLIRGLVWTDCWRRLSNVLCALPLGPAFHGRRILVQRRHGRFRLLEHAAVP